MGDGMDEKKEKAEAERGFAPVLRPMNRFKYEGLSDTGTEDSEDLDMWVPQKRRKHTDEPETVQSDRLKNTFVNKRAPRTPSTPMEIEESIRRLSVQGEPQESVLGQTHIGTSSQEDDRIPWPESELKKAEMAQMKDWLIDAMGCSERVRFWNWKKVKDLVSRKNQELKKTN